MELYVLIAVLFIWNIILSLFVFKTRNHYKKLISHTGKHSIEEILERLIEHNEHHRKDLQFFEKELKTLIDTSQSFFHKIEVVRFNPFGRSGGDQSFVMVMLDSSNSGIVINFLYTHDGLRVYTKKVKRGVGEDYELSAEEKKAIDKAIKAGG